MVAALAGGAAGSCVFESRSERMINDSYPLGFKISLHRKDLGKRANEELRRRIGTAGKDFRSNDCRHDE